MGFQSRCVVFPVPSAHSLLRRRPVVPCAQDLIKAGKEMVVRRFREAGVADDIESMIEHEFIVTPSEWAERYNLKHGAVFGLSHGVFQLACFRPPVQSGLPGWPDSPKIKNLHFVGASTRPGASCHPARSRGSQATHRAQRRKCGLAMADCACRCSSLTFVAVPSAGNGVPLVMMGVNTTVENILKEEDTGAPSAAAPAELSRGAASAR